MFFMHSSGTYIVLAVPIPSKVEKNFMSQFFIKHIIHSLSNYQSSPETQKVLIFAYLKVHINSICLAFSNTENV